MQQSVRAGERLAWASLPSATGRSAGRRGDRPRPLSAPSSDHERRGLAEPSAAGNTTREPSALLRNHKTREASSLTIGCLAGLWSHRRRAPVASAVGWDELPGRARGDERCDPRAALASTRAPASGASARRRTQLGAGGDRRGAGVDGCDELVEMVVPAVAEARLHDRDGAPCGRRGPGPRLGASLSARTRVWSLLVAGQGCQRGRAIAGKRSSRGRQGPRSCSTMAEAMGLLVNDLVGPLEPLGQVPRALGADVAGCHGQHGDLGRSAAYHGARRRRATRPGTRFRRPGRPLRWSRAVVERDDGGEQGVVGGGVVVVVRRRSTGTSGQSRWASWSPRGPATMAAAAALPRRRPAAGGRNVPAGQQALAQRDRLVEVAGRASPTSSS